jgi:TonB family protein
MYLRVLFSLTAIVFSFTLTAQEYYEKKNGRIQMYVDDVLVEGMVKNHVAHGTFVTRRAGEIVNGKTTWKTVSIENFRMGIRDGLYVSFDDAGDTTMVGRYRAGHRTGSWRTYENRVLTGSYSLDANGNETGWQYTNYVSGAKKRVAFYQAPGDFYEWRYTVHGQFLSRGAVVSDTLRDGTWYFYDTAQVVRTGMDTLPVRIAGYHRGVLHGSDQMFAHGKTVGTASYESGLLHGKRVRYAGETVVAEELFARGKREGMSTYYASTGTVISREPFVNGQRHGTWMMSDSLTGRMTSEAKHQHDTLLEHKKFAGIVMIYQRVLLEPDSLVYSIKEWYASGQPMSEGRVVGERRTGNYASWYANGRKKMSAVFVNDRYHGVLEIWNDKGVRVFRTVCTHGRDLAAEEIWNDSGVKLASGTSAYENQRAKYIPYDVAGYSDELINVGQLKIGAYPQGLKEDYIAVGFASWHQRSTTFTGPEFVGNVQGMIAYIDSTVKYPHAEYDEHIQGENVVTFTVRADGSIVGVCIHRPLSPGYDAEAVRLVQNMPRWTPAIRNGRPCETRCWLEIDWELKEYKKW